MNRLNTWFLTLLCSFSATVIHEANAEERPSFGRDEINIMNNGDLCPKEATSKYHHHFVLVDATTDLTPSQLELVRRLALSRPYLDNLQPLDRVSIMRMQHVKPSKNRPLFSKCRPRSGNPASPHKIDKHDWKFESQSDLANVYKTLFVGGIDSAIKELGRPRDLDKDLKEDAMINSPIMSQIKQISNFLDLEFTKDSGYESRKLTIVSDLAQNTKRLPFFEQCPGSTPCPSWEEFKSRKKQKLWAKRVVPDFGNNIEVELIYLNGRFDPNLDKNILEFWIEFFEDAGIENLDFEIEVDEM